MKNIQIVFIIFLMVSCAPIRVNYDYEKTTDFSKYKTYNYYSNINSGLSELDTKRLLDALDMSLQAKGFSLSETPDFFIDIKSSDYHENQSSTVGVGMGGTGRHVGGGISIGIPIGQADINRQIQFDFVDENGHGLFWQAVSESSFNPNASPEKREALFAAIVSKVLERFPPKK
ncbi:MAG TPA: DUF4136 domain-containing protein [Flavobacteriaceae bacterium]|jgi:hypothetical protein